MNAARELTPEERAELRSELIGDNALNLQAQAVELFGPPAGIFLRDRVFWDGKGDDPRGFTWDFEEKIRERTGLKQHQQRSAVKALRDAGVLEVERRGVPCRNFYRIDLIRLRACIAALQEAREERAERRAEQQHEAEERRAARQRGEEVEEVRPDATTLKSRFRQLGYQLSSQLDNQLSSRVVSQPSSQLDNQPASELAYQRAMQRGPEVTPEVTSKETAGGAPDASRRSAQQQAEKNGHQDEHLVDNASDTSTRHRGPDAGETPARNGIEKDGGKIPHDIVTQAKPGRPTRSTSKPPTVGKLEQHHVWRLILLDGEDDAVRRLAVAHVRGEPLRGVGHPTVAMVADKVRNARGDQHPTEAYLDAVERGLGHLAAELEVPGS